MSEQKILVIIPAYNAAPTLLTFLPDLLQYWPQQQILLINDGSTDTTSEVASSFGITSISHPKNHGKGEALKTGFRYAIHNGYDAVLTLDADGQHDPSLIASFLSARRPAQADVVIGSRMTNPHSMPFLRWCSNTITSKIVSWRAGCRIPDSQSGYRLIGRDVLTSLPLTTSHYQTESEILIRAGRAGFRIVDTPIPVRYAGEPSFIRPFRDIGNFIALIVKSLFW
ncbi:MAG: glycosyltransferase family 2 protein [Candidatus Latescibacteria bacterium]|nr:glycosyltransferase family 2 protein [Candidatus Latescibacterota bacterium]